MSEDSVREKVREMAKLSVLTDRISDVQEKNLKLYPFVFFEGLTSAAISYDLSNDLGIDTEEDQKNINISYKIGQARSKHLRVSYHLKLDERLNQSLPQRFTAIENAVRTLFWPQVKVEVFFNETKVYESKDV